MRLKTIFISFLFFISFIACGSKEKTPPVAPIETKAEKVQDFAYAQKDEFVKSIHTELNKINSDLKELEAKSKNLKNNALTESKKKIKAMQKQYVMLNEQLEKVEDSTESSWLETKSDFNSNLNKFKNSVGEMRTWLSEKIAI
jgi:chromosome segregation ATPase